MRIEIEIFVQFQETEDPTALYLETYFKEDAYCLKVEQLLSGVDIVK